MVVLHTGLSVTTYYWLRAFAQTLRRAPCADMPALWHAAFNPQPFCNVCLLVAMQTPQTWQLLRSIIRVSYALRALKWQGSFESEAVCN